ncbi:unnamed protein product [Schistosoma margrebowiei]|uniref:Uncharacterized protein n=1 Tax=Schistosoma margrebowiei TaxID=48269 RepID=A0A183LLA3_9TREM|nr:unnamed protein product [Schistosoma margrebowiei]
MLLFNVNVSLTKIMQFNTTNDINSNISSHKFVGPVELVQHHSTQLDGFLTLAQLPLNRPVGMSPIVLQGLNANDLEHNLRLKAIEMGLKGQSVEEALNGPMRNHLRFLVIKDLHLLQPWYHHTIRRYEAESRLASEGNQDGAFLVRYRKEDRTYVLSLTSQNEPKHYRIEEYLSRWSIEGGQYFETIMEVSVLLIYIYIMLYIYLSVC